MNIMDSDHIYYSHYQGDYYEMKDMMDGYDYDTTENDNSGKQPYHWSFLMLPLSILLAVLLILGPITAFYWKGAMRSYLVVKTIAVVISVLAKLGLNLCLLLYPSYTEMPGRIEVDYMVEGIGLKSYLDPSLIWTRKGFLAPGQLRQLLVCI